MRIKLILLSLSVLLCGLQTGCAHQNELGNLSIVIGLFLESQADGYLLIADCGKFSQDGKEEAIATTQIKVSSPSLQEAFSSLEKESELPLYFSRAKVFLLGNDISEEEKKMILTKLFDSRLVPADILILQANFSATRLLHKENSSFGLPIENQLKKDANLPTCKLYQLMKNKKNNVKIPTVALSENGFFVQTDTPFYERRTLYEIN